MTKSGIEMLEEILSRLKTLEQRLNVVDNNIKAITNVANLASLVQKAAGTPLENWAKAAKPILEKAEKKEEPEGKAGFKNFSFQSVDAAKTKGAKLANKSRTPVNKIMVSGRLKIEMNKKVVPLSSVAVKIYDIKDKLVKTTKTNRAGSWRCQLAPGKYVALFEGELDGKKLQPQNKNFEVPAALPEGQTEMEII